MGIRYRAGLPRRHKGTKTCGELRRKHFLLSIALIFFATSCTRATNPERPPITDAPLATDLSQLPNAGQLIHDTPNGKLWTMPLRPQAESTLLFPQTPGTFAFQPVWSATTKQIAYGFIRPNTATGVVSSARIWSANLDGTSAAERAQGESPDFAGTYRDPAWAHDGRSIWATVQLPEPDERSVIRFRAEIRRIDLATGNETIVIAAGRGPALSPNGQQIAYLAADTQPADTQPADTQTERNAIWLAALDGSDPQILVAGDQFEEIYVPMRFSPDGKTIAFAAADAANQLQRTPPAPNAWRAPFDMVASWFAPTAIHAHGLYPADVWLVDVETGNLERLTNLSEDHPTPVWSPDGQHIAFAGVLGVYVIDVAQRSALRITDQGVDGQINWVGN